MKKLITMVAVAMAGALSAATFKFTCDKPDGVYALGEKATITVEVCGEKDAPPTAGFSAFNVMPSKDKEIYIGLGQGHAPLKELHAKLDPWLTQD